MKNNYNILITAYRLFITVNFNSILLVDDNKVIAKGKLKKLLAKNKTYTKLYKKRSFRKVDD